MRGKEGGGSKVFLHQQREARKKLVQELMDRKSNGEQKNNHENTVRSTTGNCISVKDNVSESHNSQVTEMLLHQCRQCNTEN